ncbi:hypothetical protein WOC76_02710 [Methylocystis sp. IM3]|jgi:hypothetical protein|uniref:hypothetical protein n=1 Tax=unclassified Methylocystis TaxID=2625913 RepID=UPI00267F5F69
MDDPFDRRASAPGAKSLSSRDVVMVLAAVAAIVFANVGVVRALDVALDVLHR